MAKTKTKPSLDKPGLSINPFRKTKKSPLFNSRGER